MSKRNRDIWDQMEVEGREASTTEQEKWLHQQIEHERNLQRQYSDIIEAYRKKHSEIGENIRQLRHELGEICNHEWDRDPPMYQTPSSWTCRKCCKTK